MIMSTCKICEESFHTLSELEAHRQRCKLLPCLTCANEFKTPTDLEKHMKETYDHARAPRDDLSVRDKLQLYLQNAYFPAKVKVARQDRKDSREKVQNIIKKIMRNVVGQKGGELYTEKIRPAGSTATQTKVGKADEFDYNVILKAPHVDYFKFEGDTIKYKLKKDSSGRNILSTHLKTKDLIQVYDIIPPNYAVCLHENNPEKCMKKLSYHQEVIPRWVQEDLYKKVNKALVEEELSDLVSVRSCPHGPAITLVMKPGTVVKHEITVDFAASIDVETIPVTCYDWPRPETKRALRTDMIDNVKKAGIHLVPKQERFWYISFSKAVRELLELMDGPDECRKTCHMILKKDIKTWQSQSSTGMKGISTYIFKHHLLWMNEKPQAQGYWDNKNIGNCYMDMLNDLADKISQKKLFNYFNEKENILEGKDGEVCVELVNRIKERSKQLMHIQVIS